MLRLIKQVTFVLLSLSRSLVTKCVSLNNEPCMIRPIIIDLKPVELTYYPFMISLDKCSGICNSLDDLSTKIYVPSKTNDVNVKIFKMITIRNEAKTLVRHISYDVNANPIVKHLIQIKNGTIKYIDVSVKNIVHAKIL